MNEFRRNFPLIKRWVASLLDGSYKQGTGLLNNGVGDFCCLGVLCDLVDPDKWLGCEGYSSRKSFRIIGSDHYLTEEQKKEFGIKDKEHSTVVNMNDSGKTFAEISTWITENILSEEKESETQS